MNPRLLLLLAFALPLLAGCGARKHAQVLAKSCPAPPAKLAPVPPLPPRLPTTRSTTLTSVQTANGATVVQGYVAGGLGAVDSGYRTALAGYRITSDRRHTGDEELAFAGAAGRGQLKLVQACANRTTVAITFRRT